jgi:hypothetical protein
MLDQRELADSHALIPSCLQNPSSPLIHPRNE